MPFILTVQFGDMASGTHGSPQGVIRYYHLGMQICPKASLAATRNFLRPLGPVLCCCKHLDLSSLPCSVSAAGTKFCLEHVKLAPTWRVLELCVAPWPGVPGSPWLIPHLTDVAALSTTPSKGALPTTHSIQKTGKFLVSDNHYSIAE